MNSILHPLPVIGLTSSLFLLTTLCEFSTAGPAPQAQGEGQNETTASSTNSTSTISSSHVIKIRALIDGADTVKIQGNKVWYEHESWDLPGKWQGRDENTLINDKPWHPEWLDEASDSKASDPYLNLQPAFAPRFPEDIKSIEKIAGRGDIQVTELPSADNQQTLAIRIDDEPYGGADWYEVAIKWSVTNVIKIKALIDGIDTVKIRGNKAWYEHESWELPGRSHGRDENTLINDKPWRPVWHIVNDHTFLDQRMPSKPYEDLQPAFAPKTPANIKLTKIAGRGEVKISQLPTPENQETLSIHLDDSDPVEFSGADWYEVMIEWQ